MSNVYAAAVGRDVVGRRPAPVFMKRAMMLTVTAVVSLAGPPVLAAEVEVISPMVAVPAPDNGGGAKGCYRVQGPIYGPYKMTLCLGGRPKNNNYQVVGGGLTCNGGLDWYDKRNGKVEIDLYRSACGKGQSWTGDSMTCRIDNWRPIVKAPGVKVVVPDANYNSLSCNYVPMSGSGYPPIKLVAKRI